MQTFTIISLFSDSIKNSKKIELQDQKQDQEQDQKNKNPCKTRVNKHMVTGTGM